MAALTTRGVPEKPGSPSEETAHGRTAPLTGGPGGPLVAAVLKV